MIIVEIPLIELVDRDVANYIVTKVHPNVLGYNEAEYRKIYYKEYSRQLHDKFGECNYELIHSTYICIDDVRDKNRIRSLYYVIFRFKTPEEETMFRLRYL